MTQSFNIKTSLKTEKLLKNIKNSDKATIRGIRQGLWFIGKDLKDTADKNIQAGPRRGRTYIRRGPSGRRRVHVASLPGESFANDTGRARRTLGFQVRGFERLEFGFRQNNETTYVKELEDVLKLNRPTLRIAVRENERNATEHLEREIEKAIKEGLK